MLAGLVGGIALLIGIAAITGGTSYPAHFTGIAVALGIIACLINKN